MRKFTKIVFAAAIAVVIAVGAYSLWCIMPIEDSKKDIVYESAATTPISNEDLTDRIEIESFLRRLYAGYSSNDQSYSALSDLKMIRMKTTPSFAKLFEIDQSFAEPSGLNFDPVCLCQDYDQLKIVYLSIDSVTIPNAVATVIFRPVKDQGPETAIINLVKIGDEWRIDDIISSSGSTRIILANSIAASKKQHVKRR